jgi:hypothetical protein
MPEPSEKPEKQEKPAQSEKAVTLNVQLTSGTASDQPVMANYTAVNVVPGVVHVEFGFIEPALFSALGRAIRQNKPIPKGIRGTRVARVAMPLDVLVRLEQQLRQVSVGLQRTAARGARRGEPKGQA